MIQFLLKPISVEKLRSKIEMLKNSHDSTTNPLKPLFVTDSEYTEFKERHNKDVVPKGDLSTYSGDCFVGIDAGSTTTKLVVTDTEGKLLYSLYSGNEGNPLNSVMKMLKNYILYCLKVQLYDIAGVTGYGENLNKTALNVGFK